MPFSARGHARRAETHGDVSLTVRVFSPRNETSVRLKCDGEITGGRDLDDRIESGRDGGRVINIPSPRMDPAIRGDSQAEIVSSRQGNEVIPIARTAALSLPVIAPAHGSPIAIQS